MTSSVGLRFDDILYPLTDDLDRASPVGAERALCDNVQKLHAFDLASAAQRTSIHRAHTGIFHEFSNFIFCICVVACDEDIKRLTSYFASQQRASIGCVESLYHFRSRRGGFADGDAEGCAGRRLQGGGSATGTGLGGGSNVGSRVRYSASSAVSTARRRGLLSTAANVRAASASAKARACRSPTGVSSRSVYEVCR